jgi:hypothetical protein
MPLFRRFGRPGLLGAVAATAVVAGTATMTSRAINGSMDRRAATQQEAAAYEASQSAAVQQPAPAITQPGLPEQLQSLNVLHTQGVLSDEEFTSAKSQLLEG